MKRKVDVVRRLLLLALLAAGGVAAAPPPASVFLEDLTWTELRDRIASGTTTALVPLGGTEQNGPHMALGKHNVRARWLAGRIAQGLGDAVVAPVMAYVPEGRISPPGGHMRWPGTLTVPAPAFEAMLDGAARSLRAHGLCHVFFLGDHGGYRTSIDRVVAALNREEPAASPCRAHALAAYYRASQADFAALLRARGFAAAEIGPHAGLADTALMLAIDPSLVRMDVARARPQAGVGRGGDGVAGDPRRASAELGRLGVEHVIEVSMAAIREQRKGSAARPAAPR